MVERAAKRRFGSSWNEDEVLLWNKICDGLEHGFAPGECRRLMADPAAASCLKKLRGMRAALMDALSGRPRRPRRVKDREAASAE